MAGQGKVEGAGYRMAQIAWQGVLTANHHENANKAIKAAIREDRVHTILSLIHDQGFSGNSLHTSATSALISEINKGISFPPWKKLNTYIAIKMASKAFENGQEELSEAISDLPTPLKSTLEYLHLECLIPQAAITLSKLSPTIAIGKSLTDFIF